MTKKETTMKNIKNKLWGCCNILRLLGVQWDILQWGWKETDIQALKEVGLGGYVNVMITEAISPFIILSLACNEFLIMFDGFCGWH